MHLPAGSSQKPSDGVQGGGHQHCHRTCGHLKTEKLLQIAEYVDLFLYDMKHMDPVRHNELTGISNELILHNLNELLRRRFNVKVRMPMLKGINDSREEIDQIIKFLLPYRENRNFKGLTCCRTIRWV